MRGPSSLLPYFILFMVNMVQNNSKLFLKYLLLLYIYIINIYTIIIYKIIKWLK